jgi:hypothetical protein
VNNMKSLMKIQHIKKRFLISVSAIFNFFVSMDSFKKDNVHQKDFFLENLGLLVLEDHSPI